MSSEGWTEEDGKRMREKIGEDPARFLDKPLVRGSTWRHSTGFDSTSDPGEMIRDRVRGIDRLQVVAAWLTVEHRLERGPRDRVVSMLEDRREHLEANGERDLPGRTPEELRELSEQLYEEVADQKAGLRDVGSYRRSRVPWPTGKDALDDSEETDDQDQEEEQPEQEEPSDPEEAEEVPPEARDPAEHPVLQGYEQAGGSGGAVAADGGTRET